MHHLILHVRRFALLLLAFGVALTPIAISNADDTSPSDSPESQAATTDAEKISGLKLLIGEAEQRKADLQSQLDSLEEDFEKASAKFSKSEAAFNKLTKLLNEQADNLSAEELAVKKAELSEAESNRKADQQAFDLIIQRRKITTAQIATLQAKLELEQFELDRLTGVVKTPAVVTPAEEPPEIDLPTSDDADEPGAPPSENEAVDNASPATEPDVATDDEIENAKLREVRKTFATKKQALLEAKQEVERLTRAIDVFAQDVAGEQALLSIATEQAKQAKEQIERAATKRKQSRDTATAEELEALQAEIDSAQENLSVAEKAVTKHTERVALLNRQIAAIEIEQQKAIDRLTHVQSEFEAARSWLQFYEGPFAPQKVLAGLLVRVPTLLITLCVLFGFWWFFRWLGRRTIRSLSRRSKVGTVEEREERATTLISVLNSAATIVVMGFAFLIALDLVGVDVTVLLGGAAGLGVAIGFGAQSLMKDYFYGAMILAENQYRVGNVVKICGITGTVENVTLRMTVLRDLEGVAHFIPHSQITTVSNLAQGWARAVFEIGVAYKEDVDVVMQELFEVGRVLRTDEEFRHYMFDDPEMLGVDQFGDSAVVIKFMIKTRPLKQWQVKREMLRRIKIRFDEVGIEIPFPHRTLVYSDPPTNLPTRDELPSEAK